MATNLATDYALARSVAGILVALTDGATPTPSPLLAAVVLGNAGTDWQRATAYPYALVAPESAERERGNVSRAVRVTLCIRAPDFAQKPAPVDGDTTGRLLAVGAWPELTSLVDAVSDALETATATSAPVESVSVSYATEAQAPAQSAELIVNFADPQAYGDAL